MAQPLYFVGTAAWTVPALVRSSFPEEGSHLERYAQVFRGVEINTSFYRDHQAKTYERWAKSVPGAFLFAVKLSQVFTHDEALAVSEDVLAANLAAIKSLGEKLGVILIQLPPKLAFHGPTVKTFFQHFRRHYSGPAVIEPRHKTWSSEEALEVLKEYEIGKVRADPEPCPTDWRFQETSKHLYVRWHGTPEIYKSRYEKKDLETLAIELQGLQHRYESIWVIFDNTTFGFATVNAIEFEEILSIQG